MVDRAESVRTAYSAKASEYVAAFGSIDDAPAPDLALVEHWARSIEGPVLDVGCGPGQWTRYLASLGLDVEGIDPVPEFIESAQARHPGGRYRLGRAEALGVDECALGGVLAWYSLIHADPDRIVAALTEFARCIWPGGGLLLGFFAGPTLEPFEHAITTAYYWPIDLLADEVESVGFAVVHAETRTDPGVRRHGAILATRSIGDVGEAR